MELHLTPDCPVKGLKLVTPACNTTAFKAIWDIVEYLRYASYIYIISLLKCMFVEQCSVFISGSYIGR